MNEGEKPVVIGLDVAAGPDATVMAVVEVEPKDIRLPPAVMAVVEVEPKDNRLPPIGERYYAADNCVYCHPLTTGDGRARKLTMGFVVLEVREGVQTEEDDPRSVAAFIAEAMNLLEKVEAGLVHIEPAVFL